MKTKILYSAGLLVSLLVGGAAWALDMPMWASIVLTMVAVIGANACWDGIKGATP
jgi:hypothetical protein